VIAASTLAYRYRARGSHDLSFSPYPSTELKCFALQQKSAPKVSRDLSGPVDKDRITTAPVHPELFERWNSVGNSVSAAQQINAVDGPPSKQSSIA